MSDLLNQASLVMIPSGYKEDTVFSQIPQDGSGDLSFTRASNGTRVNSAGLVEVCPWNLLSNSEEFTTGNGWFPNTTGGSTASQTSNYGVAPNGTTTADRIQLALNGQAYADWVQVPTTGIIVGQVYTYSIYIKSLSGTKTILFFNDSTVNVSKTITTEWVRYEYSWTATSTTIYPRFLIDGSTSSSVDLLAWGYQINIGSTAKPYFPTTDRLNVPRLTYQNGGGGCPSLLLEKQSTNLCTYSEDLSNGVYTQSNVSVSANTSVSPDGTTNADTITSSAGSPQLISPAVSFASSTNVSLFVKYVSQKYVQLFSGGAFGDYVNFDIESGAVGSNGGTTTNAQIQSFGNGWYRISATFGGYTGTTTGRIGFVDSLTAGWNSLTSTTSKSIYAWGFQIEASSYATSYIPTTSSSATRVADVASNTSITSLIGQTEGTILLDCKILSNDTQDLLVIRPGGTSAIAIGTASNLILGYVLEGSTVIGLTFSNYAINTRYKIALAYKNGDCALYVNGTQSDTDLTAFTFSTALSSLYLGLSQYFGKSSYENNEVVLFKTRLTNAELASLTTL